MTPQQDSSHLAPTCLIVGCGYLGRRAAALLLARGVVVYGTTRSEVRAAQLAGLGVRPLLIEVTQRLTLAALTPVLEGPLDVLYMIAPGRPDADPSPQEVLGPGLDRICRALSQASVRRAVLTSSTGVYGQSGSVSADTRAEPVDSRGRLLLDTEARWLASGPQYHILRLAGLYGRDRIIGRHALEEGAPLVGDPQAMLNLIHADDAASLALAMLTCETPATIELGCDDQPTPRKIYYEALARRLMLPPPQVLDGQAAVRLLGAAASRALRTRSKQCDNGPTCRRTMWRPRYATFQDGLDEALALML